jgi:hypothetical protein
MQTSKYWRWGMKKRGFFSEIKESCTTEQRRKVLGSETCNAKPRGISHLDRRKFNPYFSTESSNALSFWPGPISKS